MHSESWRIARKPYFALFNSLYGDYTKRNVIGLQALCHCLALSIKLTTIPKPPIVHAERLLSATVSWQAGGKKKSILFCSYYETIQKTLHFSLSPCPCTHLCLLLLLLSFLLLLLLLPFLLFCSLAALGCSPVSLKPISSITEIIFLPGHVFVQRE